MINTDQKTCCDDDIVRMSGNTRLPEQHFSYNLNECIRENIIAHIDAFLHVVYVHRKNQPMNGACIFPPQLQIRFYTRHGANTPAFSFLFVRKVLLWQTSVATHPHDFVIATCFLISVDHLPLGKL